MRDEAQGIAEGQSNSDEEQQRERAAELRHTMKRLRKEKCHSLDGRFLLEKEAEALRQRLWDYLETQAALVTILCYYPLSDELPLWPLYERLLKKYRLYFPVTGKRELTFYPVDSIDRAAFARGRMGIWEPKDRSEPFSETNGIRPAAIVPGLVFDGNTKGRIGYGGGYYDRFLAAYPRIHRIGACYEFQLVSNNGHRLADSTLPEDLPQHDGDIPMDVIITEKRKY